MVGASSPYFDKRRRTGKTTHSASCYFVESPSSSWGSDKSLRSLLFRLTDATKPICRRRSRTASSLCCSACESVIDGAIKHFWSCSIFQEHWREQSLCSEAEECWQRAEVHLDRSVRHLCSGRCYMKAFAPCRDWLSLRNSIHQSTNFSVESFLAGWRCVLTSDADSHLPRTVFITPDGKSFSTQSQVLDHIGLSPELIGRSSSSRLARIKCTPGAVLPQDTSLAHSTESISGNGNVSSPFGLLEELFGNDPWRLFLSAILLNRTSRVQVDTIMFDFLAEWPSAEAAAEADAARMCVVVRALGIRYRRAAGIIRFSKNYLALLKNKMNACGSNDTRRSIDGNIHIDEEAAYNLTQDDVMNLYYCGDYAYAAYKLFIQRDYSIDPTDHALKAYAEYQRGFQSASESRTGPKSKLF